MAVPHIIWLTLADIKLLPGDTLQAELIVSIAERIVPLLGDWPREKSTCSVPKVALVTYWHHSSKAARREGCSSEGAHTQYSRSTPILHCFMPHIYQL